MMKDYFNYSQSEQRAILVLILLIFCLMVIRLWPVHQDAAQIEFHYADTSSTDKTERARTDKDSFRQDHSFSPKWRLETFDINYARARDLRRMGFSSNFIGAWFSMKNKVGFVRSWDDFEALRLLNATDLKRVRPFMDFTKYEFPQEKRGPSKVSGHIDLKIDINQADSLTFRQLPGIGPVLSARITKYRNRLGGFHSISQLNEVYGIDSMLFERLKPKLLLTEGLVRLNINTLGVDQLASHPYISWKQAQWIVNYREQHGVFSSISKVLEIKVLDAMWFERVSPYLTVSQN